MSLDVAIADGVLASASATVDITSSGFGTPKFAIIIAMRDATAGTRRSSAQVSYGIMSSGSSPSDQASVSMFVQDNFSSSAEDRSSYYLGVALSGGGSPSAEWDAEFITDGIRFTKTAASIDSRVKVVLFGGTGIVEVGDLYEADLDGAVSAVAVTGLGFSPNFMLGVTSALTSGVEDANDALMCFGVAGLHQGSTLRQWSTSIGGEDSVSFSALEHRAANTEGSILKAIRGSDGVTLVDMSIDAFDADGFTYSWVGTQTEVLALIPIRIRDENGIYISDGTIASSATGWTSGAADRDPVFGMMCGIDGVEAKNTVYSDVGAMQFTLATQDEYHTVSASMNPSPAGSTDAKTLFQNDSWEVLKLDGNEINGSFAFNSSKEIELSSLTNVPTTRDTHLWYFMLSAGFNVYHGADEIDAVYSGADLIDGNYAGSTQIS